MFANRFQLVQLPLKQCSKYSTHTHFVYTLLPASWSVWMDSVECVCVFCSFADSTILRRIMTTTITAAAAAASDFITLICLIHGTQQ